MILTKEEQKSVVKMVMESYQNITLSEAKTNKDIKEEMKLNLEFYNSLKEGFTKEGKATLDEATGMFSAVLSVLGNIKDFLTGTKVIKDIMAWVQELVQKISEKLGPKIDQFIPQEIQDLGFQNLNRAKDGISAVEKFIKWIYNTLSYKGLAKLFAMIRYKTFKPTDEQKQCMELAAKKVYKWILITLVVAFIIKFAIVAIPMMATTATSTAAVSTAQVAGFTSSLKPIGALLAKIGHGSLFKGLFSAASAGIKAKDAKKISSDIKAKENEAKDKELDGFKGAWDYCPLPQKNSKNAVS
tara:strand:- start:82 stop:978 length:897 start_codon:yes stop_codon:yes gene_type:complete